MLDSGKKKLFFVKSFGHNLKAIESFLGKRNFKVFTETDVKSSLEKIFEIQPDFVFLAWDHDDQTITNLPKLIAQASNALVVPYIISDKKVDTRKLNICVHNPKLYPPLSGPTIERLILKSHKKAAEEEALFVEGHKPKKSPTHNAIPPKKSNITHLKSSGLKIDTDDTDDSLSNLEMLSDNHERQHILIRNQSINQKNAILKQSKNLNLSNATIDKLKNSFQHKIQAPLENLLNSLQAPENNSIIIQQGLTNLLNPGSITQITNHENDNLGTIIQSGGLKQVGQVGQVGPRAPTQDIKNRAYCMSIYSDTWCGYLIIATPFELEFSTVDIVFTEWIKMQFDNLQEVDEFDYFEMNTIDFDIITEMTKNADYYESVVINNCAMNISFFPIAPDKMTLEFNNEQNLIKIPTEVIPPDCELNFSLHLHLPENKKYLLYTPAHRSLNPDQKQRLMANKIHLLYTPLEFEKDYKKFLAEKNIKELCENIARKNSVV